MDEYSIQLLVVRGELGVSVIIEDAKQTGSNDGHAAESTVSAMLSR